MRTLCLTVFSILLLSITSSCSTTYDATKGYKKSTINGTFPVPENSVQMEAKYGNPIIKDGERYSIKNIGGEQGLYPPESYLNEIESWGWKELKDERIGSMHVFRKDGTIMWLEVSQDYVGIFELEKDIYSLGK